MSPSAREVIPGEGASLAVGLPGAAVTWDFHRIFHGGDVLPDVRFSPSPPHLRDDSSRSGQRQRGRAPSWRKGRGGVS